MSEFDSTRFLPSGFTTDEAYAANDEWENPSTARQYPPPPKVGKISGKSRLPSALLACTIGALLALVLFYGLSGGWR